MIINDISKLVMETKIETITGFIESILDTKYAFWIPNDSMIGNFGPCWVSNESFPDMEKIKSEGVNCSGLINLVRRKIGLTIPYLNENYKYAGGTRAYVNYFKNNIEKFNRDKNYKFSLLIQDYSNPIEQGHLGIISDNIIYHSRTDNDFDFNLKGCLLSPGVQKTIMADIDYDFLSSRDFYTCDMEIWLNK